MTQTFRTSTRLLVAVIFSLSFIAADGQAAQRKKAKKPTAAPAKKKSTSQARNSRAEKGRAKASPAKSAKDTHSAKKNSRTAKDSRKPSRRERLAQARREAAERRRRAEAARRAELARRAAIARQRAIDQSFRQEVAANVQKDDPTGEDLEVRRAAVAALGNYAGSVVVMDPKTGRVYTVVNQDWGVRRGFKPCSTIKLVTGLAGLEEAILAHISQRHIQPENSVAINARHNDCLRRALLDCQQAREVIEQNAEFAVVDLRSALTAVVEVIGSESDDAILDAIFAQFCIGK